MFKIINHEEALKEFNMNNHHDIIEIYEQRIKEQAERGRYDLIIDNYDIYEIINKEFKRRGFYFDGHGYRNIHWEKPIPTVHSIEENSAAYYKAIADKRNEYVLKEIDSRIRNLLKDPCKRNIDISDLDISFEVMKELIKAEYRYDSGMLYVIK